VCTVVANPTHNTVYWRRIETNGQVTDIVIDNSKYQGATVGNPSLTITNVQLADRLNYICFATNSVGTGQSSQTYLNVIGSKFIKLYIVLIWIMKFRWRGGEGMVFNNTFNNISVISWQSVLLAKKTGAPGENHRPVASHWQTLSHNVVSSIPRHERSSNSQL
jgi:hypothetical protein